MKRILPVLFFALFFSCDSEKVANTQFSLLSEKKTNIDFENQLEFNEDFNIYTYRNFYNGGGVAIGDLNNDGLNDIYFTANMKPNALYINQGDWKFENIAEQAGVKGDRAWSTGVSLVDINADGWLDIYVCNSGDINGDDKQNELFINNKDGSFTEQAAVYGLANEGFSTHAAFFDYDRDGDLDCYLLNNSYRSIGSFNLKENERELRDITGGDKLYKNEGGKFVDVSEEAGIYSSVIGFGLGVTVGDVNLDGWEDIFVSNDFFERDYLYINQQDGSFKEELPKWMSSTSAASMGADMVDLNNDLRPDIFVTEMLPESNERIKTKTTFESWDNYQFKLKNDYYHQFTRNMFQINKGDQFAEVGRYAGVSATDWSWAALGADFDLDGTKEIFVANGIYQDLTDQDFIMFASSNEAKKLVRRGHKEDYQKLIEIIPSVPISNYLFQRQGNLTYENKSKEWGLDKPSHSNGSAYGDLDNDGDLDLVVNNVNAQAFIYRNNQKEIHPNTESVIIELKGEANNPFAYGAKIMVFGKEKQLYDVMPIRGFQSTMAQQVILSKNGFGDNNDFYVEWPSGEISKHYVEQWNDKQIVAKSQVTAYVSTSELNDLGTNKEKPRLKPLNISHKENFFTDFDQSRLVYQMNSRMGPRIAVADLNGDNLDDFFLCGASGSAGQLFMQKQDGSFSPTQQSAFETDKKREDVDALFFDIDNDGDQDLYVVHGGSEFNLFSTELADVLYINDNNQFKKSKKLYPTHKKLEFGSCVAAADVNQDGYIDLFVGTRQEDDHGVPATSYLLINQKDGSFEASEQNVLNQIGMVTDAAFSDLNNDGKQELVVVGEYMPVSIFEFNDNQLVLVDGEQNNLKGWWNSVEIVDKNEDGFPDILLGNHGLNSRFHASKDKPIRLYVNDFDQNGRIEQVVTVYNGDKAYPLTLRHDLLMQLPYLKEKFLKYEDYKNATIEDIFEPEQLDAAVILETNELRSGFLMNNKMHFSFEPLDELLQLSCVNATAIDGDEIFLAGNQDGVKPEVGRQDASAGFHFAKNQEEIDFSQELGINGVVNDIAVLRSKKGKIILFARNNDQLVAYEK